MSTAERLAAVIKTVATEAAGVLRLYIVNRHTAAELLERALDGDPEALRLIVAVRDSVNRVVYAPTHDPILCAACPRPVVGKRFCIGIALPDRGDPTQGVGFAFCGRCSRSVASLPAKAAVHLRPLWPEAKLIRPYDHAAGHA